MKFPTHCFSAVILFLLCTPATHSQEELKDYDGNIYKIVRIGEQVWMAENLKSTHDAYGAEIGRICYQRLQANCDTFGGLYSWNELKVRRGVDKCQGICPTGYHIPTDADWSELIEALGGADSAAFVARLHTGFNMQYGGNFHSRLENFNYKDKNAYFWTATSFSHTAAWIWMIGRRNLNANRSTVPKVYCLSVRCIKD